MPISKQTITYELERIIKFLFGREPNDSVQGIGLLAFKIDNEEHVLWGKSKLAFNKIIENISSDKRVRSNFNEKEIEAVVLDCLIQLLELCKGKPIKNQIDATTKKIVTRINNQIKDWKVLFPIENLVLEEPIKFGKAEFNPAKRNIRKWKKEVGKTLRSTEGKAGFVHFLEEQILNNPYIVVRVKACSEKNVDGKGFSEAEKAINFLRFLEEWYAKKDSNTTFFGIIPIKKDRFQYGFCISEDFSKSQYQMTQFGPFTKQVFPRRNLKKMKRSLTFKHLKEIYSSDNITNTRIIDSISWFAEAKMEPIPKMKLVKYIVSLETLLSTKHDEKSISSTLSDRLALLLNKDVDARLRIKKKFKELYSLRSDIIHGSVKEVSEKKINDAKTLSRNAIMQIIRRRNLRDSDDILKWTNAQKMK